MEKYDINKIFNQQSRNESHMVQTPQNISSRYRAIVSLFFALENDIPVFKIETSDYSDCSFYNSVNSQIFLGEVKYRSHSWSPMDLFFKFPNKEISKFTICPIIQLWNRLQNHEHCKPVLFTTKNLNDVNKNLLSKNESTGYFKFFLPNIRPLIDDLISELTPYSTSLTKILNISNFLNIERLMIFLEEIIIIIQSRTDLELNLIGIINKKFNIVLTKNQVDRIYNFMNKKNTDDNINIRKDLVRLLDVYKPDPDTMIELGSELNELKTNSDLKVFFAFEKFIQKIFYYEGTNYFPNIRTRNEEIDIAIFIDSIPYILDIKYYKSRCNSSDVFSLIGKLSGRPNYTIGILLSYFGFTSTAIGTADEFRNIILMDFHDIEYCVKSEIMSLTSLIRIKHNWSILKKISWIPIQKLIEEKVIPSL